MQRERKPNRSACATPDVAPTLMVIWLITSIVIAVLMALIVRHLTG